MREVESKIRLWKKEGDDNNKNNDNNNNNINSNNTNNNNINNNNNDNDGSDGVDDNEDNDSNSRTTQNNTETKKSVYAQQQQQHVVEKDYDSKILERIVSHLSNQHLSMEEHKRQRKLVLKLLLKHGEKDGKVSRSSEANPVLNCVSEEDKEEEEEEEEEDGEEEGNVEVENDIKGKNDNNKGFHNDGDDSSDDDDNDGDDDEIVNNNNNNNTDNNLLFLSSKAYGEDQKVRFPYLSALLTQDKSSTNNSSNTLSPSCKGFPSFGEEKEIKKTKKKEKEGDKIALRYESGNDDNNVCDGEKSGRNKVSNKDGDNKK
jgi:hypothetical protein